MKIIKRISALVLGAALAASFAFTGNTAMVHAAGLNLVSQMQGNDGYTVNYSYNKNGLLIKSVSRSSSTNNASDGNVFDKDDIASDVDTTITTTYKYNKDNKITRKTEKKAIATTYHQMDQTGLNVIADLGTITTTVTEVTVYTYNKKGLATQSVTTVMAGISGTASYVNDQSVITREGGSSFKELSDGRVIAGYNSFTENGDYTSNKTIDNAYFLSNPSELGTGKATTTIRFTDKGDGTYTQELILESSLEGYSIKRDDQLYGKEDDRVVPLNYDSKTKKYIREDGTPYTGNMFRRYKSAAVVEKPSGKTDYLACNMSERTIKTVITTKYSYDKKNRVKKAVATTVDKVSSKDTKTYTLTTYVKGDAYNSSRTDYSSTKSEEHEEDHSLVTTEYKYDRNGHAIRKVLYDNGVNSYTRTETERYGDTDRTETVITYNDGTPTATIEYEAFISNPYETTTTVMADGIRTETTTYAPYTVTKTRDGVTDTTAMYWDPKEEDYVPGTGPAYTAPPVVKPEIATPGKETTKYTYDRKGTLKTAKTSGTKVKVYTAKNPTYGNEIYEVDEKGNVVEKKITETDTYRNADTYENTVKDKTHDLTVVEREETKNRAESTAFTVGYKKYKLARKNIGKTEKIVRKQQWILRNGQLNGEIGLL